MGCDVYIAFNSLTLKGEGKGEPALTLKLYFPSVSVLRLLVAQLLSIFSQ